MPESQTWREPTTVVAIEWDYYNSPVVDKSPGVDGVKELHPEELGLSADLSDRLMSWMDRHSGPDDDPEPGLAREELTLAYDLQT